MLCLVLMLHFCAEHCEHAHRWHCYIYDMTNAFKIAFKRNKKAFTLDAAQQTKADNDMIMKVDPQLLHLY